MHFVAIDVETANADFGSICQIGIAEFSGGQTCVEWCSLIDPETYFDEANIDIHGITEAHVRGKPTFPDVAEHVRSLLKDRISLCHSHFDRVALQRACIEYDLEPISTTWLDSARVARRTWEEVARKGYGLQNVCRLIGYEFRHHDALEDAKAAGHVLLAAIQCSGMPIEQWLDRVQRPITIHETCYSARTSRDGNPEGDLFGEVVVFTGALSIARETAADLAALAGCKVTTGVSKKTTLLVVGNQDMSRLAGHEKSSKHRAAEELAAKGHPIRIIREHDFMSIVNASCMRSETEH